MTDNNNNNKKQLYVTGSANAVRTAARPAASKLLTHVCAVVSNVTVISTQYCNFTSPSWWMFSWEFINNLFCRLMNLGVIFKEQ